MSLRDFRMTILLSDKHCSFALVLAPPFHSALIIYNSSNDAMPMPPSVASAANCLRRCISPLLLLLFSKPRDSITTTPKRGEEEEDKAVSA